ncbi:GNAT family N-acetyltransferase [Streptomyces beigongshangae]|uniref:GNAT family N-acetyltransferase n=1 Tax=Streptomyces beigongshangae TaxID=2841597 RepID=UPI001C858770|nr:GNAT family N-acetyltransferase [Streptomyces sp. REN17]
MTTTLRPTEPLQRDADGALSRHYTVCVNSRPVGAIHLASHPSFGSSVGQIRALSIEGPDRGRGRGTVAALAAEEVARGWGCRRLEVSVPADAAPALRLTTALGYVLRNRTMEKRLDGPPAELPAGSRGRAMTEAEFASWVVRAKEDYAQEWITRGVPEAEARAKADRDHDGALPDGLGSRGMDFRILEHEGAAVGVLWLASRDDCTFVYKVETGERHRGRGHGRSLMLHAEARAVLAGHGGVRLNVFAGNTPAERLYESLGYGTTTYHFYKDLL